jgi:hypothetical protein
MRGSSFGAVAYLVGDTKVTHGFERGRPARVFDDAPTAIKRDAAHKMKHWM